MSLRHLTAPRRLPLALLVVSLLLALATTGARAAASSGVHVDPGSPAAKQYAIPLAIARGGATGSSSTERFGAGITAAAHPSDHRPVPRSRAGSAAGARSPGRRARRSRRLSRPGRSVTRRRSPAAGLPARAVPPVARVLGSSSATTFEWTIVPGAFALLLGAVAATLRLRRRKLVR